MFDIDLKSTLTKVKTSTSYLNNVSLGRKCVLL